MRRPDAINMIISQAIAPQGNLLTEQQIRETLHRGLDGRFTRQKVLVLIPDHTRSLPLPFLFRALVDILQPCISFNKTNTHAWYKERCHELPSDHDPTNWDLAMRTAKHWGDEIPVGIIYRSGRPSLERRLGLERPLVGREVDRTALAEVMAKFG